MQHFNNSHKWLLSWVWIWMVVAPMLHTWDLTLVSWTCIQVLFVTLKKNRLLLSKFRIFIEAIKKINLCHVQPKQHTSAFSEAFLKHKQTGSTFGQVALALEHCNATLHALSVNCGWHNYLMHFEHLFLLEFQCTLLRAWTVFLYAILKTMWC